jgi:hypothetical protein
LTRTKLDINQKVYVEGSPVLGDGAGDDQLGKCIQFAPAHVADANAPTVRVCGTGVKMTAYLRNRCEAYYEHSHEIGSCNKKDPPGTCEQFGPADDKRFGTYQSYRIEQC